MKGKTGNPEQFLPDAQEKMILNGGDAPVNAVKIPVLIALTIIYVYEMTLHLIRMRSAGNPIPDNVADAYDPETDRKWRRYHREKSRLRMLTTTV